MTKLTLTAREIAEDQVKSLFGSPVTALYEREGDVWELAAAGRAVLDYDTTKTKRIASIKEAAADGPYLAATGAGIFVLGLLWTLWSRRPKVA